MFKALSLSILLFALANNLEGQTIDTCIIRYKYTFFYQTDSVNERSKSTDQMILELGKKASIYYSIAARIGDSIANEDVQKGLSPEEISANRNKYNINKSRTLIIKNYPESQMTIMEKVAAQEYTYSEYLLEQSWKILNDTIMLKGLKCQKATTRFRGRDYIAWFSKDIPIPNGPWKFYGLPGLIINIHDVKNLFSFELAESEIPKQNILIQVPEKRYIKTERKKVWDLRRAMANNPYEVIKNSLGIKIEASSAPSAVSKIKTLPFNPIELE